MKHPLDFTLSRCLLDKVFVILRVLVVFLIILLRFVPLTRTFWLISSQIELKPYIYDAFKIQMYVYTFCKRATQGIFFAHLSSHDFETVCRSDGLWRDTITQPQQAFKLNRQLVSGIREIKEHQIH